MRSFRGHFICHFTVISIIVVLLNNAKTTKKQCRTREGPCFESDFAAYHDITMYQIRKPHKTFKNH